MHNIVGDNFQKSEVCDSELDSGQNFCRMSKNWLRLPGPFLRGFCFYFQILFLNLNFYIFKFFLF